MQETERPKRQPFGGLLSDETAAPAPRPEHLPGRTDIQQEIDRLTRSKDDSAKIRNVILTIIFVAMAAIIFNTYVARFTLVHGTSMEPTLQEGNVLIFSPLGYTPQHGDVVVTEIDLGEGNLIKRVIGVAGDVVDVDGITGQMMLNGKTLDEPYILEPMQGGDEGEESVNYPVTVPRGQVFLMGDNRNHSLDSRTSEIGMVPQSSVMGKVLLRVWPLNELGTI